MTKSSLAPKNGLPWMEGARGREGRMPFEMPKRPMGGATFSPRYLLDSHCGKDRIGADDADYILETFPIVRRHDEEEFGEYTTKRVILERYASASWWRATAPRARKCGSASAKQSSGGWQSSL